MTTDTGEGMASLGGIGNALDGAVAKGEPSGTLNMGKEDVGLRFRPGDFQAASVEIAEVDRLAVGVFGNLPVTQMPEHVGGVDGNRTVGVVQIDQVIGAAVEGIAPGRIGCDRDFDVRLVKGGDEAVAAIVAANEKRDEMGLEKRAGLASRAGAAQLFCGLHCWQKLLGSYAEGTGAIGFLVQNMRPASPKRGNQFPGVVLAPPGQTVEAASYQREPGCHHCSDSVPTSFQFGSRERVSRAKVQISLTSATSSG